MKIALITAITLSQPGGVTSSFLRVARSLRQRSIEVEIVTIEDHRRQPFVRDGANGITQLPTIGDIPHYSISPWSTGSDRINASVDIQIALESHARERCYDVLHGFYVSKTGFLTTYAARELGCASIISVRGNDIHQQVWNPASFAHTVWALQHASAVTAVSDEAARRVSTIADRLDNVSVILNSVDQSIFSDSVQEMTLRRPVVGTTGVLKSKKGVEFLLCAFSQIRDVFPNATLLIVGDTIERERNEFEQLILHYELNDSIHLTGMVPHRDVLSYMRTMDVFLHASYHEGCPNVILEAFLSKVPVIATPVGAVPSLVKHQVSGFLVNTSREMAEHTIKLLEGNLPNTAMAAYESATTHFVPSREADQFEQVYRAVSSL